MTNVETGRTYYTGNLLAPTMKTVVAVATWESLPARTKRNAIHFSRSYERADGQVWVRFRTHGQVGYLPVDVFTATSYETHDAMIEAYTVRS